jgi:putative phage-type endonuclease
MIEHTAEWHEWRRQGIGGSDVADLLNLEPYGCARRLWYVKRGQAPDMPETRNPHMERGRAMEQVIANMYASTTKNVIWKAVPAVGASHPFLRGNADRLITRRETGYEGVLEIKCPAMRTFLHLKKSGLPEAWILQMQHYLVIYDLTWGAFAILWAEGWEFLTMEVRRDDEMIAMIIEAETAFWKRVETGSAPDALTPGDKRCGSCRWAITCLGLEVAMMAPNHALDPAEAGEIIDCRADAVLVSALDSYIEVKKICNDSEFLLADKKEALINAMDGRAKIRTGSGRATWNPATKRLTVTAYGEW